MFIVLYITTVLCAFVLQTNGFFFAVGSAVRVDLALLAVVYFSLFGGRKRALLLGFGTGFLYDALSSELLGLNALSKCVTAFVVSTLCHNVQINSLMAQGLFTALAIAVDTLARLLFMGVLQSHTFPLSIMLMTLTQQTVLSVLLMPCICYGLHMLAQGLRLPQEKG